MSFSAPSNISQNDAEILEKQQQEMQWRHEEEQQLLAQLEEAAKSCWAERTAQKAKRKVEEKERKRRTMEYFQWLWDKVLEEEATLLEGAEGSQIMGFKHKEVATRDEEGQQPSKKARGKQPGKYYRGATVKIEGSNPCKRCVYAGQDCLVYPLRWVINNYTYYYFLIIFFFIATPLLVLGALHSSSSVYPTPILILWPWSYGRVLSAIEKALQELVEEYRGVGKEESGDDMEGSEDGPRESQEEGTPSSASC